MTQATLDAHLNTFTATNDPVKAQIAETVRAFAAAAILVRKSINEGALGAAFLLAMAWRLGWRIGLSL